MIENLKISGLPKGTIVIIGNGQMGAELAKALCTRMQMEGKLEKGEIYLCDGPINAVVINDTGALFEVPLPKLELRAVCPIIETHFCPVKTYEDRRQNLYRQKHHGKHR